MLVYLVHAVNVATKWPILSSMLFFRSMHCSFFSFHPCFLFHSHVSWTIGVASVVATFMTLAAQKSIQMLVLFDFAEPGILEHLCHKVLQKWVPSSRQVFISIASCHFSVVLVNESIYHTQNLLPEKKKSLNKGNHREDLTLDRQVGTQTKSFVFFFQCILFLLKPSIS